MDRKLTVSGLWPGLEHCLAVDSILAERSPGRVVVDDPARPTAGLMWDRKIIFFVGGNAAGLGSDTLRAFLAGLAGEISRAADEVGARYSRWFRVVCSPGWEPFVEESLRTFAPRRARRVLLAGNAFGSSINWRAMLPPGFRLAEVDDVLLNRPEIAGLAGLREEILGAWRGLEVFLRHGFGFAALDGDSLAAWCLSEFNSEPRAGEAVGGTLADGQAVLGPRCEIGVETLPPYQGRGLGTCVVSAFIERCLASGVTPFWHSAAENAASLALAEKVGFERAGEYGVLRLEAAAG